MLESPGLCGQAEQWLVVRKVPKALSSDVSELQSFFKRYGPTKILRRGKSTKTRTILFKYPSQDEAARAYQRISRLTILGSKLVVEYATNKLQSTTSAVVQDDHEPPIAAGLGIVWGPPPTLLYKYPPATPEILDCIRAALESNVQLYTQVMYLMNKMNLPCPVPVDAGRRPGSRKRKHAKVDQETSETRNTANDSDESEWDSEKEQIVHKKCSKKQRTDLPEAHGGGSVSKAEDIHQTESAVHEPSIANVPKSLINALDSTKQSKKGLTPDQTLPDFSSSQMVSTDTILNNMNLPSKTPSDTTHAPSSQTINDDTVEFPALANRPRLSIAAKTIYIKNLHPKKTTVEDLHRLFDVFDSSGKDMCPSIRLMSEGRMRGQAFVTYENEADAKRALNSAIGVILHDKAMVVQYGRS
ncbi:hypothetical protein DFS34DRAFT_455744 [Phlyctochytrium arcticum]|nr:hypothetical protein DFS34DRAFT_455744 [Phlyctochytrium arcticum]